VEILLTMGAAVAYGVSDYTGGVLTRRAHVFVVFLLSQLVSFALLLAAVAVWAGPISWPGVGWGVAAGGAGVVGTSLLYQGLAIGRMSVVAPITGVLGAVLPVLFGLAIGERPGPAALTGILAGLVAVITSLYPAVTVALAGLVLRERLAGRQVAGLGLAAVSVVLIALG
jgi:drug/metabolite transporter (DMT)-like permease